MTFTKKYEHGTLYFWERMNNISSFAWQEALADRYRVQLEDYAAALTRLTGRKVSEKWIYSFTLGREIRCDGRSRMSPD